MPKKDKKEARKPTQITQEIRAIIAKEQIKQADLMSLWGIKTHFQITNITQGKNGIDDNKIMSLLDKYGYKLNIIKA